MSESQTDSGHASETLEPQPRELAIIRGPRGAWDRLVVTFLVTSSRYPGSGSSTLLAVGGSSTGGFEFSVTLRPGGPMPGHPLNPEATNKALTTLAHPEAPYYWSREERSVLHGAPG
ncbi:hypothetical protein GX51_02852 [Blastomyces parvus]|uniref:Uncharacterized protein n=1 Tax=Blastomyces parvus TaxID=2060905 RepID=A0A2B7XAD6_9EURO|nr:hypothetical protein GX51_02852 [Blastomyces parvus]